MPPGSVRGVIICIYACGVDGPKAHRLFFLAAEGRVGSEVARGGGCQAPQGPVLGHLQQAAGEPVEVRLGKLCLDV